MGSSLLLWTQPAWIAEAQAWIEATVHNMGRRLNGSVEQFHVRPWSTVMRVTTDSGLLFFKAIHLGQPTNEVTLTLALSARSPDCMPEIIAADAARGWMITRDAGVPLRPRLQSPEDLHLIHPILRLLAGVQMKWLNQQDELIASGADDGRLEKLPERFNRLADNPEALMIGQPNGLSERQFAQLQASRSVYHEMCARLVEFSVPQSIHYDDMHTSNVFLRINGDETPRITFSDWGDSCAGHPFCSMLIFLRSTADCMNLPDEATETPEALPPMLARLRDVYLEPWQVFETHAKLVSGFNLAWRIGMVARALSWNNYIGGMDEAYRQDYQYTVPAWLGEFLLTLP